MAAHKDAVTLLMPRETYILSRFMAACLEEGVDVTVCVDQPREAKWQLLSFVNGEYGSSTELDTRDGWRPAAQSMLGNTSAVVPTSEFSVQLGEYLAAELGVLHNPLDAVPAYRDKFEMRQRFRAAGLSQPDVLARFTSLAEVDAWDWGDIAFPVIVKPQDLTSSLYVQRVHTREQARQLYRRIFKHTQSFAGVAFTGAGLLETYVEGPEFSAECVVQDGRVVMLFVTTKFVSIFPACDEIGHMTGAPVAVSHRAAIEEAAQRIAHAWALRAAVLHVEYKFVGGQVVIMESACRIGGDFISELVHRQHGVDLERELVRLRLGRPVSCASATPADTGLCHGIRFLFGDSRPRQLPAGVSVLREVAYRRAASASPGFGIHQRIGYQVLRATCPAALQSYLSTDCPGPQDAVAFAPTGSRHEQLNA